jgi:hypothetical protein
MYLTKIRLIRGHFVDAVGKSHGGRRVASFFQVNYGNVGKNIAAVLLAIGIAQPRSMYSASPERILEPEIKCNFSADCPSSC